jgi:ubiquinone/menaquinone biosynthesis C-methylase UbiE
MHKAEKSSIQQFDWWAKNSFLFTTIFTSLNRKISRLINLQKGGSLLDIGCGWGLLLKELARKDPSLKLFGIDISPEMVRVAKRNFQNSKQVEIKEGSAAKLPYKSNSFNTVTCILSFHHHPDSQQSLREMYRVLKPKGKLLLLDPFNDGLFQKFILFINALLFDEKNISVYTKIELLELFKQAGFKNVSQRVRRGYHLFNIAEK